MLINGINAQNGNQNAARAAIQRRQQAVIHVTKAESGHHSPPKSNHHHNIHAQRSVDSGAERIRQLTESNTINYRRERSGQVEREALHPKAKTALNAYLEPDITEQRAEISRLMGIDVYA